MDIYPEDICSERAAEPAKTMAAAGWTVEHRYTDPDSPWAGGVMVSKNDVAVSIVADRLNGGSIAAVSSHNDYTGSDPVKLAESLRATRY